VAGVQHQAQMNIMLELYSGRDKWTFTKRDMRNRYDQSYNVHIVTFAKWYCVASNLLGVSNSAIRVCRMTEFMRETSSDDILKLLESFDNVKVRMSAFTGMHR
jgi:hypothetical protein